MEDIQRLLGLLEALACDCDLTDGWQDAAPTVREAATTIEKLRELLARSRKMIDEYSISSWMAQRSEPLLAEIDNSLSPEAQEAEQRT